MAKLGKWMDVPINFLMWASCFIGFLMMMHVTIDVFMKHVSAPLEGTIEIVSGYYMVAVAFLPLAYISKHEGQIVVELFTRGLTGRRLARFDGIVNIATFLYLCLLTWKTTDAAVEQTIEGEMWETATGFIHMWPSRWLLPIGCFLMAIYLLVRIWSDLRADGEESGAYR